MHTIDAITGANGITATFFVPSSTMVQVINIILCSNVDNKVCNMLNFSILQTSFLLLYSHDFLSLIHDDITSSTISI